MPALATWAPEDGVLGAIAPVALAIAQLTGGHRAASRQIRDAALVVDLDPLGPAYPSARTLRELVNGGPRAADLAPLRAGIALLANGGVSVGESAEIVELLIRGWPAVILRLAAQAPDDVPAPVVPVRLLAPGRLFPPQGRGVYQPVTAAARMRSLPSGSVLLPRVGRTTLAALLEGRRPPPSRWLRSWRAVWEVAW